MQISRDRIRLQVSNTPTAQPQDVLRSAQPAAIVGNDLAVEVALFLDDQSFQDLADISDVATLTLDVKPLNSRRSLPVMSATLSSGDLNPSLTLQQWQSGDPTLYHALFTFVNGLTALELNADTANYWFTIYAWTNDATPRKVTWGCGQIQFIDDGSNTAAPAFVQSPTYVTLAQGNALWGAGNTGNKVNKTGDIMSGTLRFSGTTNYGIQLSNLTATQIASVGNAAGGLAFNTTATQIVWNNGSAWAPLVMSVNGATGTVVLDTDDVAEGTAKYFTTARVLATALTGLSPSPGTVVATDTVLQAMNKLVAYANAGAVTSVGLTMPGVFSVTGSPVTSTGTIGVSFQNQSPGLVLASPASGGAAAPAFRALVATDIPMLSISDITSLGTTLAGLLPIDGSVAMTGALTLAATTPIGNQATPFSYTDATYLKLAGGTMTGALNTANVTVNSANTISWGTAPTNAAHLVNKAYADGKAALTGAQFTGNVTFNTTTSAGVVLNSLTDVQINAIVGPGTGSLAWNNITSQVVVYNGSAWVAVSGGTGSGAGTTWLYGPDTPNAAVGANGNYFLQTTSSEVLVKTAGSWSVVWTAPSVTALQLGGAQIAGNTMTGDIKFSSTTTTGLFANQLTSTQITAIGAVNAGAIVYNSTTDRLLTYRATGSAYQTIITADGATMTGNLLFTGTTVAGVGLNNLTTTQVNALASPANGSLVHNTTTDTIQYYNGSAWFDVATGWLKLTGGQMVGNLSWANTATGVALILNNLTTSQQNAMTASPGMLIWNTNTGTARVYNGGSWVDVGGGSGLPLSGGTMTGNIAFNSSSIGLTADTSGGNAPSGNWGYYVSASSTQSSGFVSFGGGTTTHNVLSFTLPAGDWDVWGVTHIQNVDSFAADYQVDFSATSGSIASVGSTATQGYTHVLAGGYQTVFISNRYSLATSTTIYMVVGEFNASPNTKAWGFLQARIRR